MGGLAFELKLALREKQEELLAIAGKDRRIWDYQLHMSTFVGGGGLLVVLSFQCRVSVSEHLVLFFQGSDVGLGQASTIYQVGPHSPGEHDGFLFGFWSVRRCGWVEWGVDVHVQVVYRHEGLFRR